MGCDGSKNMKVDEQRNGKDSGQQGGSSKQSGRKEKSKQLSKQDTVEEGPGEFTELQVDILSSTWPLLASNMEQHGVRVFLDIFETEPKLQDLFRFRNVEFEKLEDNQLFRSHATVFMQQLDFLIRNMEDIERVSSELLMLGAKHAAIQGFSVAYFPIFIKCLQKTWEQVLGEEWTEDVNEAWRKVFDFMEKEIWEGYHLYMTEKDINPKDIE